MIVLSDTGFHAAEGDPSNLKLCQRGEWEDRMLVETVLSMLTLVCHLKKVMHRGWAYFQARLAFTMAAFNVLVQWHGFQPNASGLRAPLEWLNLVCNIINPAFDRRLGNRNQEQYGKKECQVPETDPAHDREVTGQPDHAVAHMLGGRNALDLWGEVHPAGAGRSGRNPARR